MESALEVALARWDALPATCSSLDMTSWGRWPQGWCQLFRLLGVTSIWAPWKGSLDASFVELDPKTLCGDSGAQPGRAPTVVFTWLHLLAEEMRIIPHHLTRWANQDLLSGFAIVEDGDVPMIDVFIARTGARLVASFAGNSVCLWSTTFLTSNAVEDRDPRYAIRGKTHLLYFGRPDPPVVDWGEWAASNLLGGCHAVDFPANLESRPLASSALWTKLGFAYRDGRTSDNHVDLRQRERGGVPATFFRRLTAE